MNKKEYKELLKDDKWRKLRLQIIKRDNYKCTDCGKGRCELQVHHKLYINGKKPWEYEKEHLQTLCEACHKNVHDNFNIPVLQSTEKAIIFNNKGRGVKPKKEPNISHGKKKKLKPWEKIERNLKNRVNSINTKEVFVQRICLLYHGMGKNKEKRLKALYEIRKYQRSFIEKFGTDFNCFPIEIMNNLFLNWDG